MACQVVRDSKGEIQQVLAPNGKESILFNDILENVKDNEEALRYWAQVYTPQFKEWFGNSKVVDENGEPLLVYHQSRSKFDTFRESNTGLFFSEYYYQTPLYKAKGIEAYNTLPVFLSLQKPYISDNAGIYKNKQGVRKIKEENLDYDGIITKIPESLFGKIVDRESGVPIKTEEIIAFRPNQVKSLFNQGDFSTANHSIYLQKGDDSPYEPPGKVQTIAQKLHNRFSIPYSIVNDASNPNRGWFSGDGVTINLAHARENTAFHEYLHPFVLALKQQNPNLYKDLMNQLSTDLEGMKTIGEIAERYPELSKEDQMEEALVEYLGKLSAQKYNKPSSPFNRFIKWLKSLLKKIQIDFKDFRPDMTLSELGDIIIDDIYVADLRATLMDAKSLTRYQKPDTELTYAAVYDRIKDKIAILNATIRNRKKGDQFREDIKTLNDIIQNEDEVTSINNFISNSVYYIDAAQKRFEQLRKSVKNADKLSKDELSYNLNILGEIQQLLNVYDSLDDVKSLLFREGINEANQGSYDALRDAIDKKDLIIEDFKSFALTYLTEWLYPYLEPTNKNLEAQGNKNLVISKEEFRKQLVTALRDISAAGYWLGTTINSRDPVSAAVGLALKDVVYENHVKDLAIKDDLTKEYNKARGTALYKSAKDEEAFNQEFLREVQSWEKVRVNEETGEDEYDYRPRLAFYQEYQTDVYDKAKREFYEKLGPRPVEPDKLKAWKNAVTTWYAQNTVVDPRALAIMNEKRKTLTKRQFEQWLLANTKEVDELDYGYGRKTSDYYGNRVIPGSYNKEKDTFLIFSGTLIKPAEKYKDRKFPTLMRNEYYRKLYNTYKQANDQLSTYGLKHGIIPQLSKGGNMFSDLQWKDGIKENIKKAWNKGVDSIAANLDNDKTVQRQDGSEVKGVPVYYTRMLDSKDLKLDLLEATLVFSQMSNNYQSMTEIEPNIIVLKTVLNGDFNLGIKGREVAKTNTKGIQVFNAITKKIVPKMAREDMLNNRLNEFINDVVYGDDSFDQTFSILGKELSANKLSNKVALFTALSTMATNINGGISNITVGNFNNSIEAVGKRFYSVRDWGWAQGTYAKELPNLIKEVGGGDQSFLNKLADHYDVPQGEFKDHYGRNVSKGQFNKLMKTSTLFFIQKGGEHQIQVTGMLALMHSTKVTDSQTGKEVSLYEAKKSVNNDPEQLLYRFNWDLAKDTAFRNRLHAIIKNLHGVYNSFDKAMLQRRWYGKLALMFRKYLFKAMSSRWGSKYVDYELGTDEGGYWTSFMSKMLADAKEYKWGMIQRLWSKEGYNEFQKSAANKTMYEFTVIIATFVLAGIIGADDDKDWLDAEMALLLTRFSADITQYINPADFIRVIRNPAASINLMEKFISWFTQLFHPFEEYERASGFAKKGDYKLWIKTLKLVPVVRQFINILTPEEQIKFYQLTGR